MKRTSTLNLLYPPFLIRLVKGIKSAQRAGIPCRLFETMRTHDRQAHLYSKGRTSPGPIRTKARPGRSWHNYGIAGDIAMYIDGKWSWDNERLFVEAAPHFEKYGLQWYGRNKNFIELVHYQLPQELNIYEAEAIYRKRKNLLDVWQEFNKRYGDKDLMKWLD